MLGKNLEQFVRVSLAKNLGRCSRQREQHRHRAETCLSAASIDRDLRQFRFTEGRWKARNETGRRWALSAALRQ